MLAARAFRFSRRRPLTWCLILALLVVQGFGAHFHRFADHQSHQDRSHAVELHLSGLPTDSGQDDPDSETDLGRFAILKIKNAQADGLAVSVVAALLLIALVPCAGALWRFARFLLPLPDRAVRTPPLRAPPV